MTRVLPIFLLLFTAAAQEATVVSPRNDRARSTERSLTQNSVQERVWFRDRLVQYREVNGLAIVEGDIILGPASAIKQRRVQTASELKASFINGAKYRWIDGEVPYVVDNDSRLKAAVDGAIKHWESKTSYRFVPRKSQENYVRFVNEYGMGCASYVGMLGGQQLVYLEQSGCDASSAIHEIGHTIGLWHEQSRNDRNNFVQVLEQNIAPSMLYNFDLTGPDGTDFGYYDYNSIMHYPDWAFSANGRPVLVTIPSGIRIGQRDGLSPSDIDVVERMNGKTQHPYVIDTNPSGFPVTVDNAVCTTPCSFSNWQAGSRHTLSVDPVSYTTGTPRMHGVFARWNDDGAISHEIVADPTKPVITANLLANEEGDLPDLIVTSVSAPAEITAGDGAVPVSVEVKNIGKLAAGPFKVGFYLSGDASITRSDRYLGWYCSFDTGLAVDATATCRGNVDVPAEVPTGRYYFGAVVDDLAEVGEANELNNALAAPDASQVNSSTAALPDLQVTAFSAPVTASVGGSLAGARIDVVNQGQGASGRFRVGVYLSKSATISTSATYTRWSCSAENGLEAGGTFTCTGDIGVPSGLSTGLYYLGAIVDDLGEVKEAEEANNTRVNDQGRVTLNPEVSPKPDLIVTSLTAPTAVHHGQRLSPVVVEVKNVGSAAAANAFRIAFAFSETPGVTAILVSSDRTCDVPAGLAAGAVQQCMVDLEIPDSLTPGTYYLSATADDQMKVAESNESNNSRVSDSGAIVLTAAPEPDLIVKSLLAPPDATGRIQGIQLVIKNQGSAAAGAFQVGLYLSQEAKLTSASMPIGTACTSDGLAAGASFTCMGEVIVPQSLTPGSYYLAAVADDGAEVAEADEANNARFNDAGPGAVAPTPRADLVLVSFTAPTTAKAGGSAAGSKVVVKNQGLIQAGKFRIGFYISTTPVISRAAKFTGWYCMVPNGLAPGEEFTCIRDIGIPEDLTPGTYFLGALADDLGVVAESGETNNGKANEGGPTVIN